jgi:hypothetical protein
MLSSSAQAIDYRNLTDAASPNDGVVIDLAKNGRIQRLMEFEDISADLDRSEEARLVDYVRAAFKMSHERIRGRYDHWREADRAHDVYVPPDTTAFREKVVIADTRAIADTVLTYLMSALTGRNPMFQLEGNDRKSRKVAAILERILHKHIRNGGGEARIAQQLLDSIRYGFAPTKVLWDGNKKRNQIVNFDPRACFPDPRVSWGDWERMQFIGFSEWTSYDALRQSGLYPKLAQYPGLRRNRLPLASWECNQFLRESGKNLVINPMTPSGKGSGAFNYYHLGEARPVNELWVRFSGYEVNLPGLDDIWLVIAIMDEQVCIRLQLNPYGRMFPVIVGGFFHDFHKTYGQSLYDIMLPLHYIATWLLRSRVDNVQAALNNLIFADPNIVNIVDLIDRNPWGIVRTLPGAKPGDGIFVAQVPDVTRGHWNDIAALSDLKQRVAAASDAQQGMPTADVRTATEIQRLTALGSKRLGTLSRIMSATQVRPMVEMMVGNIQDAVSFEGSIRLDPYNTPGILEGMVADGYLDFTIADLQGPVDYLVIDGTLPTEPSRDQQSWMNVLQILSNTGLGQEYNLGLIAEEAIRAGGIHDLDKFRISQEQRAQGLRPYQQFQLLEKLRGATVMPTEDIMRQAEKGNLVPMNAGRGQGSQGGNNK